MKTIKEIKTQIVELQKELDNLERASLYKRWRAEENKRYYFIQNRFIHSALDVGDNIDNWNYNYGNYFKTKEEAEKARDRELAIIRVNDMITELNEGWVPSIGRNCYYIYYCYDEYLVSYDCIIYFDKVLKYINSREIAEQIITEMKDDLNLIFNIK